VLTIVALPAIWLFTRGEASRGTVAPSLGAAGLATPEAPAGSVADTASDPFGTNGPIFIDGPTTPPKPAVIQIVVPRQDGTNFKDGAATYKRAVGAAPDSCSAPNAAFGATLTVTNRDNGRVVTCVNRKPVALAAGLEIVLSADQFEKIGRLVDAPIPVRVSWTAAG